MLRRNPLAKYLVGNPGTTRALRKRVSPKAFKVLDRSMVIDVPMNGFTHPFNSPGGYYREGGWWPLDSAIAW